MFVIKTTLVYSIKRWVTKINLFCLSMKELNAGTASTQTFEDCRFTKALEWEKNKNEDVVVREKMVTYKNDKTEFLEITA